MRPLLPVLVLPLLLAAAAIGQSPAESPQLEFVGDKRKKVYYRLQCDEALRVPAAAYVPLTSKADAERLGFRPSAVCSKPKLPVLAPGNGSVRYVVDRRQWRLVMHTTPGDLFPGIGDPKNFADLRTDWARFASKSIRGNVTLTFPQATSGAPGGGRAPQVLILTAGDGSGTLSLHMRPGGNADRLRDYLVRRRDGQAVALISFRPGSSPSYGTDGELVDYQIYERRRGR